MATNNQTIDIFLSSEDFDEIKRYMNDSNMFVVLKNAYDAVSHIEAWNFLYNFNGESFTFCPDPMVGKIYRAMEELGYSGHSGSSFGLTLREMEFLAKNGKKKFIDSYKNMHQ